MGSQTQRTGLFLRSLPRTRHEVSGVVPGVSEMVCHEIEPYLSMARNLGLFLPVSSTRKFQEESFLVRLPLSIGALSFFFAPEESHQNCIRNPTPEQPVYRSHARPAFPQLLPTLPLSLQTQGGQDN